MIYISTFEDLSVSSGVQKKIYSQARWFAHYINENVDIFLTKGQTVFKETITQDGEVLHSQKLFNMNSIFEKANYYRKLVDVFQETNTDNFSRYKIAYIRVIFYDKHLLNLLMILKKQAFQAVLEIPTSTFVKEYINTPSKGWYKLLNFLLYHKKIYQLADLIVSIGEMPPILKGLEQKILVMGNGIDLLGVTKITTPRFEKELHLIGVANVTYWHGYDRVIIGLWEYYRKTAERRVYFHIVGDGAELPKLKKLTKKLKLEEYVVFDGPKHGDELDRMFDSSHVAVASLGMHRSNLKTGSTLKVREYCARGIPFVVGYEDVDFPKDFPFSLRIPSDESPIDIQKVISFYKELKKTHSDYPLLMRKYAEEHLSWEVKMKPLVERIKKMR
jgi:glycosyltransferase involved in cell wall biosynthesis